MSLAARLERDPRLAPTVLELDDRRVAFNELRDVMRLSNAGLPRSDKRHRQKELPALELLRLQQIKSAVDEYKTKLKERVATEDEGKSRSSAIPALILKYFERYGARLFGHPARFDAEGQVLAVVDRTNNVLEQFFGEGKRLLRRRIGRANLGMDLEQQPAQAALVPNLRSPEYVRVLCGSLAHLPAAFAEVDAASAIKSATPARDHRHKELRQRLRQLLGHDQAEPTSPGDTSSERPVRILQPAAAVERWPDLQHLSEDELRELHDNVFPAVVKVPPKPRDPRLPPAGTRLTGRYKGKGHQIIVGDEGFTYRGQHYTSLSTIATVITGSCGSGYVFFRLTKPWGEGSAEAIRNRRHRERYQRARAAATRS